MADPRALNVEIEGKYANEFGDQLWIVGLADGRRVHLKADRMTVGPGGALIAWQDTTLQQGDDRQPLDEPVALLILAPGQWLDACAASPAGPLMVERIDRSRPAGGQD